MKGFKLKYWIIPIVLLVAVIVLSRSELFSKGKAYSETADNKVTVKVASVEYVSTVPQIALNGSLEARTSAAISAKVSGNIEQVLVEEGQYVKAGDPLIRLNSIELANSARMAQDTVVKAQANYDLARADYQRYQTLYSQDAISQQELETAQAKFRTAQAELSSAVAGKNNARQQYNYGVITAPIDGVVANKTAVVGQVASPGTTLMVVNNIREVYAVVNVEQGDLSRIRVGQKAAVLVDAYPDKTFTGTVEIMNPQAGLSNRMFRTKIKVDNPNGILKPGMFIKLQLAAGNARKALIVPSAAVMEKQGLYYVFAVENNKVVRCPVTIGDITGNTIEIKSGLQRGQKVVVTNVSQLKDGETVRVDK